jgi:hypothetical protein
MLNVAIAVSLIGGAISAVFIGLAKLRMADAWRIWARRCDPKNPNFKPPLFESRK